MAIVRELSGNQGSHNSTPNVDMHNAHNLDPINKSYPVIPDDANDLINGVTEAVICGAAGLLKLTYANGNIDTVGVQVGINRLRARRIWATGTTATGISAAS